MTTKRQTIIEACARAAHEANRSYCLALGDTSQVPWEQASEELQASCRQEAHRAMGGATPEQLHEGWMAERTRNGWVHGAVKDADKKTHPCLVPYAELPAAQKHKDHLFQAVVVSMTAGLVGAIPSPPEPKPAA